MIRAVVAAVVVTASLAAAPVEAQVASCDGGCTCTGTGCTCNAGYCGSACTNANSCVLTASPGTRASFTLPVAGSSASCVNASCAITSVGGNRVQCESATCQGTLQGGTVSCEERSTCTFVVTGSTNVNCDDTASCTARCDGQCAFTCRASATCSYSCADGGAPTSCGTTRSVCGELCDGGTLFTSDAGTGRDGGSELEPDGGQFLVSRLIVGCSSTPGQSPVTLALCLLWWWRRVRR